MKNEDIDKEILDLFSLVASSFGLHETYMKLAAALYMNPDPLTMEELSQKLGYSLGSISISMRALENLGIVTHEKKPGSKKLYYNIERNIFKINLMKLDKAQTDFIDPMKREFSAMMEKHKKNKDLSEKMRMVEKYYNQLLVFEGIMTKWKSDLAAASEKHG